MTRKIAVKHRLGTDGMSTACGREIWFGSSIQTNKTWKGVTCQKCLKVRAKQANTTTRTKVGA